MDRDRLEARVLARGEDLLRLIGHEMPSVFRKGWWTSKVMRWAVRRNVRRIPHPQSAGISDLPDYVIMPYNGISADGLRAGSFGGSGRNL